MLRRRSIAIVLFSSFIVAAMAQFRLEGKLTGRNERGDLFGQAVALDSRGELAIVVGDDSAAHVFARNGTTWREQQKLHKPAGTAGYGFGHSVALYGNNAIVSAHEDDAKGGGSGAAFVFNSDTASWAMAQKLLAFDGTAGDMFGISVALHNNTALVGAPGARAAYAFQFNHARATWQREAKLLAADAHDESFGFALALDGFTALVGAHGGAAVFVFVRLLSAWEQQQKLVPNGADTEGFGWAVAVEGDTAIIGAIGALGQGAAFVFVRSSGGSWRQHQRLIVWDGPASDKWLGYSVGVSGDLALVGARRNDLRGAVYVFVRIDGVWRQQQQKLVGDNDLFGTSLAVANDTAIVGAVGRGRGVAYMWRRTGAVQSIPIAPSATTESPSLAVPLAAAGGGCALLCMLFLLAAAVVWRRRRAGRGRRARGRAVARDTGHASHAPSARSRGTSRRSSGTKLARSASRGAVGAASRQHLQRSRSYQIIPVDVPETTQRQNRPALAADPGVLPRHRVSEPPALAPPPVKNEYQLVPDSQYNNAFLLAGGGEHYQRGDLDMTQHYVHLEDLID